MPHHEQLHYEPIPDSPEHIEDRGWDWASPTPERVDVSHEDVHQPLHEPELPQPREEGPVRDYADRAWGEWAGPVPSPEARDAIRREVFAEAADDPASTKIAEVQEDSADLFQKKIDALVPLYEQSTKSPDEQALAEYSEKKDELFNELGFRPHEAKEVLRTWALYLKRDVSDEAKNEYRVKEYRANLEAIAKIEAQDPGAAAQLYREYGIRNFMRFEPDELIRQLHAENTGSTDVMMVASDDWSKSFSSEKKMSQARQDVLMDTAVYIEVSRPIEAFTRLVHVKERHGSIERIMATSHGDDEALQLSPSYQKISAESLRRTKAIEELVERGVLEPDVEVMLSSCGGMKLAEEISKQTDGLVVASGEKGLGLYKINADSKYKYEDNIGTKAKLYEAGERIDGHRRIRRVKHLGKRMLRKAGVRLAA